MTRPTGLPPATVRALLWVLAVAGAVNLLAQGVPALNYESNATLNGLWLAMMSMVLASFGGKDEDP